MKNSGLCPGLPATLQLSFFIDFLMVPSPLARPPKETNGSWQGRVRRQKEKKKSGRIPSSLKIFLEKWGRQIESFLEPRREVEGKSEVLPSSVKIVSLVALPPSQIPLFLPRPTAACGKVNLVFLCRQSPSPPINPQLCSREQRRGQG